MNLNSKEGHGGRDEGPVTRVGEGREGGGRGRGKEGRGRREKFQRIYDRLRGFLRWFLNKASRVSRFRAQFCIL